jgi:hypothetical protein
MLNENQITQIIDLSSVSPVVEMGGNSTVKKVLFENRYYAIKNYSNKSDGLIRLMKEFKALKNLHEFLPDVLARPYGFSKPAQIGIYSWLSGHRPYLNKNVLSQMLEILARLHCQSLSTDRSLFDYATDSILLENDLVNQIQIRLDKFKKHLNYHQFGYLCTELELNLHMHKIDIELFGRPSLTLSFSDFGPHNLLWDKQNNTMHCIDLEFFGWDDAHKLVIDTLSHPQTEWSYDLANKFLFESTEFYNIEEMRLFQLWPLINLKWASIVLSRIYSNLTINSSYIPTSELILFETYIKRSKVKLSSQKQFLFEIAKMKKSQH